MNEERDVYVDPLFVGLTRPATVWGVPYGGFVAEFMVVTIIFLAVGDPFYMLLVIPVHAILYLVSAHDPNVFRSWMMWLQTNGRCKNTKHWGAVSFSPLPTKKWIE